MADLWNCNGSFSRFRSFTSFFRGVLAMSASCRNGVCVCVCGYTGMKYMVVLFVTKKIPMFIILYLASNPAFLIVFFWVSKIGPGLGLECPKIVGLGRKSSTGQRRIHFRSVHLSGCSTQERFQQSLHFGRSSAIGFTQLQYQTPLKRLFNSVYLLDH